MHGGHDLGKQEPGVCGGGVCAEQQRDGGSVHQHSGEPRGLVPLALRVLQESAEGAPAVRHRHDVLRRHWMVQGAAGVLIGRNLSQQEHGVMAWERNGTGAVRVSSDYCGGVLRMLLQQDHLTSGNEMSDVVDCIYTVSTPPSRAYVELAPARAGVGRCHTMFGQVSTGVTHPHTHTPTHTHL